RRLRRRFLVLLLFLLLAAGAWVARALRQPWPAEQGVSVSPDEGAWTSRIVASAVAMIDGAHAKAQGRPYTRDVHSKAHGCVKARVEVPELEPRLRHGLFARSGSYDAWVRFSSGDTSVQSDLVRDARGFALKVMGVPGEKLLPAERHEQTQDFVMINSRQFFIRTLPDYEAFTAALARGSRYGWFFDDFSWKPWRWRLRELYLAGRTLKAPPASLLQTQFHSLSAYRLGPSQFVKYSARPCEARRPPRRDKGEGMLRASLKADLASGEGCFDLLVQLQVAGKNMPVEDATVLWSEKDSPFLEVARVTIPRQEFDTPAQDEFCENLSFTPWHALPEHEPVGVMNRVRRALYQEISRYRHAMNAAPRAEPRGFCLDLTGATCGPSPLPEAAPGPPTGRGPAPPPADPVESPATAPGPT
ncbi:MAG TPA: catalase family protein, partial [Vicinamibacteria bacterium]